MSLLDRSRWEQLQAQCWKDLKERREKRICLKCGIYERCTINKVYAKDNETVLKYVINSEYEYNENTLDVHDGDICSRCRGVLLGWYEFGIKTTNRPEMEAIFKDIQRNEAHDLFMLTSNRPEMTNTLPAYKRKLKHAQLPIATAEQKGKIPEYNAVIEQMTKQVKELERRIDQKIRG